MCDIFLKIKSLLLYEECYINRITSSRIFATPVYKLINGKIVLLTNEFRIWRNTSRWWHYVVIGELSSERGFKMRGWEEWMRTTWLNSMAMIESYFKSIMCASCTPIPIHPCSASSLLRDASSSPFVNKFFRWAKPYNWMPIFLVLKLLDKSLQEQPYPLFICYFLCFI
jgi:hypothetical protein